MLFSHLTTKNIDNKHLSHCLQLREKKIFDETHLSKLSCGTCLHMQVTAEFVKNCCFWQQFRSCRRKEVVSLSLWTSQTEPVLKCLSPKVLDSALSSRDLLLSSRLQTSISVSPRGAKPMALHLRS